MTIQRARAYSVFSLSVVSDSYMLVIMSGKGSLAKYRAVVGFVGDLIKSDRERRVLVDMLASEPNLSAAEHREVGDLAGRLWQPAQVALVVSSPERIEAGVQAARAANANIRTFTNLGDAGDWLNVQEK